MTLNVIGWKSSEHSFVDVQKWLAVIQMAVVGRGWYSMATEHEISSGVRRSAVPVAIVLCRRRG